jgi:mono/diheme cytochrome c family protein
MAAVLAAATAATPFVVRGQSEGAKIYAEKCASCHAADGSGNTTRGKAMKVPDLRSPEFAKKRDKDVMDVFSKPAAHRGLQKQLGDDNLRLVVTHLRSLKK